jgi:hypothetical protein
MIRATFNLLRLQAGGGDNNRVRLIEYGQSGEKLNESKKIADGLQQVGQLSTDSTASANRTAGANGANARGYWRHRAASDQVPDETV